MAVTRLGLIGLPTGAGTITAKADTSLPPFGMLLGDFDVWQPTYGAATVLAVIAGTTQRARLFSDPGLTTEIANPQTLLTMTDENGDDIPADGIGKMTATYIKPLGIYEDDDGDDRSKTDTLEI